MRQIKKQIELGRAIRTIEQANELLTRKTPSVTQLLEALELAETYLLDGAPYGALRVIRKALGKENPNDPQ